MIAPDYQKGSFQLVTYCINCSPENDVFQALMAVSPHDHQVGLELFGITHDSVLGIAGMANDGLHWNLLIFQCLLDFSQILPARLHFRSRGKRAINLAGHSFFDVQQIESGMVLLR